MDRGKFQELGVGWMRLVGSKDHEKKTVGGEAIREELKEWID